MKILLVDDDRAFRRITAMALEAAGHEVTEAPDAEQAVAALDAAAGGFYAAILLDIEMPGEDGFELLVRLREAGNETPVLFVSGRERTEDKVRGLQSGADDYLVKPIEVDELVARIEAVVRRRNELGTLEYGDMKLDLARRRVERRGDPVQLSPREYDLLLALARAEGRPISKASLLRDVWGLPFDPETNVVEVHIGRVRRKLDRHGRPCIETVRGEGYRLKRRAGDGTEVL